MDDAAKLSLLFELSVALGTLAGHGVGLDLSRPLGQQAQGFFDRAGQLFFDLAQVLLRMGEDHLQAGVHVFKPGRHFGFGQLRFGQGCGLGGGSGFGRCGVEDLLAQAPDFGLGRGAGGGSRRFPGLRPANLAGELSGGVG